jgi:hypothetical protein
MWTKGNLASFMGAFQVSDIDQSGDPKYYGYLAINGEWYIMENTSDTQFRFAHGYSGYATAWTNRATQTYTLISEMIG